MLAIGLGHAAIGAGDAGHRVYYTTSADLVARCHKAALESRWANTMPFFAARLDQDRRRHPRRRNRKATSVADH